MQKQIKKVKKTGVSPDRGFRPIEMLESRVLLSVSPTATVYDPGTFATHDTVVATVPSYRDARVGSDFHPAGEISADPANRMFNAADISQTYATGNAEEVANFGRDQAEYQFPAGTLGYASYSQPSVNLEISADSSLGSSTESGNTVASKATIADSTENIVDVELIQVNGQTSGIVFIEIGGPKPATATSAGNAPAASAAIAASHTEAAAVNPIIARSMAFPRTSINIDEIQTSAVSDRSSLNLKPVDIATVGRIAWVTNISEAPVQFNSEPIKREASTTPKVRATTLVAADTKTIAQKLANPPAPKAQPRKDAASFWSLILENPLDVATITSARIWDSVAGIIGAALIVGGLTSKKSRKPALATPPVIARVVDRE
jgi:hypothetical protein